MLPSLLGVGPHGQSLPLWGYPCRSGMSGVHFLVENIAEYRAIFPRCVHQPPRSAMWNTYAFTRSGYGIRPLATLSTATGNEIFGSVLISPALLTPPNKQTNKIIPSSRDLSGLATVGPHYTNCINEHCPLVNSSVNCQVYSRESEQLFCMY
jgi:hypothetical protein